MLLMAEFLKVLIYKVHEMGITFDQDDTSAIREECMGCKNAISITFRSKCSPIGQLPLIFRPEQMTQNPLSLFRPFWCDNSIAAG